MSRYFNAWLIFAISLCNTGDMNTSSPGNSPEKNDAENSAKAVEETTVEETSTQGEGKPTPELEKSELSKDGVVAPTETQPQKHNHKMLYGVIAVLAVLVLGAIAAFMYFAPFAAKEDSTKTTKQSVLSLKGEVAIVEGQVEKQLTATSWGVVEQGDSIATGDTLRTGADSRAVVNLDDGSAVRLDQNSTLEFTKLSNTAITLTQLSGRAYHRVQKGQLVYSVKSLDTTATALGTSFSTSTDAETSSSQVMVLESKVKVTTTEVEEDVQVDEGKVAVVDNEKHEIAVNTIDTKVLEEEFYQWNTALNDGKTYVKPTPTPTPTPNPTQTPSQEVQGLTLSVTPIAGGVKLSWVMSGQSAPQGFKVLKASHANPTFGQDHASYISDPNARSYEWTGLGTEQYYFRVGIYNGNGISWYSNIKAATPLAKAGKETSTPFTGSITLSHVSETGGIKFNWSATNAETVHGWKLVYSSAANPTYPEHTATFVDANARTYLWKSLPSGTYHFRIGAWIDGKVAANAYSNDITVTVP